MELTWRDLTALEPRLAELRAEISQVHDDPGQPSFCANEVWYTRFKPRLVELVGWNAGIPHDLKRAGPGPANEGSSTFTMQDVADWHKEREPGFRKVQQNVPPLLKTDEAYDLAYEKLYELLPDCRNCTCA